MGFPTEQIIFLFDIVMSNYRWWFVEDL